jgi:hypothetical protein
MTQLDELRELLRSRRAHLTPADVDLPVREGSRLGLSLIIYSTDTGSPSEEKPRILAGWSAAR